MIEYNHRIVLCLWCAQPMLQAAVAAILWRRKLHKQFPVFFMFLLAQVANFAVTFPLWATDRRTVYFGFFWLGEAINAVLGFKVIHEIFVDVFRPYHTLKDLGSLVFKWAGVVMLLVAVVVAFSNSADRNPLVLIMTTLQPAIRVAQVGLVLFLLLFSRFLGVSRKQVSFGISLGFGLLAGADLMLLALHSGKFVSLMYLNLINLAAYVLANLVWLGYSVSPKAVRDAGVKGFQTRRWEQSLADIQNPVRPDSLIPMFESMVERAFSRNSNLEAVENQSLINREGAPLKATSAAAGSKTRS
jgi:hypothetical protein